MYVLFPPQFRTIDCGSQIPKSSHSQLILRIQLYGIARRPGDRRKATDYRRMQMAARKENVCKSLGHDKSRQSACDPIADNWGKPNGDIVILGPAPHLTLSLCGYPNFLLKKSIKR